MEPIRSFAVSFTVTLAALHLPAAAATPEAAGLSRSQVKAELAVARAAGGATAGGEVGPLAAEWTWTRPSAVSNRTPMLSRAQVRSEFLQAEARGELVRGEHGLRDFESLPGSYPARPAPASRPRIEVKAEYAEARRLGRLVRGEEGFVAFAV